MAAQNNRTTKSRSKRDGAAPAQALDLWSLNEPQRTAVLHDEGPLLVLAGAGSGKTRVIIYRIARLIKDGIAAKRIIGLTFTNKAAREMRQRLALLAGPDASGVTLCTFHALGLAMLQAEHEAAGLRPGFCIYDTSDQLSLVRDLMRQVKVADRRLDAHRVLDILLKTKRERRDEVAMDWGDDYELAAYDLYPRYLEQMRAFNAIDFDDLILRSQDLLNDDAVRARWQQKYDFLLVDEYQDTSPDQLHLVRALAGPKQNVCAVGDDDQAIYAWRGAAVDNILAFSRDFSPTREVVLEQNYRSTGNILAAANAVIKNNSKRKAKALWSGDGAGAPVEVVQCADGDDEAAFVAETITRMHYQGVPYRDIAILYRANQQSRIFEETLALESIPFRVVGGQAFFDRKEVRDALAFLAVINNSRDEVALRRVINVPPRGIGTTSLERLAAHGEQHKIGLWGALAQADAVPDLPSAAVHGAQNFVALLESYGQPLRVAPPGHAGAMVRDFFTSLQLKDAILAADDAPHIASRRLENLEEVQQAVSRFEQRLDGSEPALTQFLRSSALVRGPQDQEDDPQDDVVTLMTLHSAKGLEFPYVLMVGVEEDLLPHKKLVEEGGEISEERRLCYVGITRARKRLWITSAAHRRWHGKMTPRYASRFLSELPDGDGVMRRQREQTVSEETNDAMAQDFFKKMRAQLGIEA